jgi:anti-sigma factor RsiW
MNHDEAMSTYAVEAYVLNDLRDAEKEAFEAHMFFCKACADQVLFLDGLQKSTRGDPDLDPRFHTVHAAAAYVLGDLSGRTREDFEAHMLRCKACFAQVNLGVKMLVNFHRAVRGEIAPGSRRLAALRFSRWFQLVFGE